MPSSVRVHPVDLSSGSGLPGAAAASLGRLARLGRRLWLGLSCAALLACGGSGGAADPVDPPSGSLAACDATAFQTVLHAVPAAAGPGPTPTTTLTVHYRRPAGDYSGWQLQKAVDRSKQQDWEPFSSLQPLYNLLDRSLEWELVHVCQHEGLGIVPWSPLRGGWLSGKYHRGMAAPVQGTRIELAEKEGWSESWSAYANERTWRVLDELFAVAAETGKQPAQVALRWLLQRPGVTAPIIGVRTLEHLDDNLGATGWTLSAEQMARLTQVSEPALPYPYDVITSAAQRR